MSDLEMNKKKSIDYEGYQINIFDDNGKMVVGIKKGNCNFLLKSKMSYSEKFNFVVESDSLRNIITIFLYNKREKTPLFRLPTSFINKFVNKMKPIAIKNVKIEFLIIFGSVAGLLAICISIKKQGEIKEIYIPSSLEEMDKKQKMYNFVYFNNETPRMKFEIEKDFTAYLIRNTKKELSKQTKRIKERTDYF